MEFSSSKSKHNLARAFAGLCQDSARYAFMAKSAGAEGFEYVGQMLKMLSRQKLAQSGVLYSAMLENITNKKENVEIEAGYPFESKKICRSLQDSSEIERYEGENLFLHFAKIAKDEGFNHLASIFDSIAKINLENATLLGDLAQKHDSNRLYTNEEEVKWTCSNCGNYSLSKRAWSVCPLCGAGKGFVVIDIK